MRLPLTALLASTTLLTGCATMTDTATTETAAPAAEAPKPAGNALTANWTGPYGGVPPWDKMQPDLFPGAFEAGMAEVKAEVDAIVNNPAPPTFENTHVPMMLAGDTMGRVFSLWGVQS